MVRQSEGSGGNDLKRKWSLSGEIGRSNPTLDGIGDADDEVATDRQRARLEDEHGTDEEYDGEYLSGTDDDDDDDDDEEDDDEEESSLTDASSSSTSTSESDLEDSVECRTNPISLNSPASQSLDEGSTSPRSVDSDPDRTRESHRNKRKTSRPMKSPNPEDPKFKGVTVQFRTLVNNGEVQLLITAYFNCRKVSRRRCSWKAGSTSPSSNTETSDTSLADLTSSYNMRRGKQGQVYHPSGKQCASCCTRKTPLWRDAEDGTPLCNACGIRYKKYRVRCGHCWFVPKKESKTNQICSNCGERFRFSVLRFKHSIN